jgi:hypothetical protein
VCLIIPVPYALTARSLEADFYTPFAFSLRRAHEKEGGMMVNPGPPHAFPSTLVIIIYLPRLFKFLKYYLNFQARTLEPIAG